MKKLAERIENAVINRFGFENKITITVFRLTEWAH